jgi:hypothetical protein
MRPEHFRRLLGSPGMSELKTKVECPSVLKTARKMYIENQSKKKGRKRGRQTDRARDR